MIRIAIGYHDPKLGASESGYVRRAGDRPQLFNPATATGTSCQSSPDAVMHEVPVVSVTSTVQVPLGNMKISMTVWALMTPITRRSSWYLALSALTILSWEPQAAGEVSAAAAKLEVKPAARTAARLKERVSANILVLHRWRRN